MDRWRNEDTQRLPVEGAVVPAESLQRDRPYLVAIAGHTIGEMYPVAGGLVLGRGPEADVRIQEEAISRRHALITVHAGEIFVEDLGSKNGTYVNGIRVRRQLLADGDKVQVGSAIFKFAYHDKLEESFQRRMYESALRDALTGVYNRKYMDDRLQNEIAYSLRHASPLSLLLFDIDHFKLINDANGHLGGDAVLIGLAKHVLRVIRSEDVFARYGGEEFMILSRGITLEASRKFAQRLRAAIEGYPFMHEGKRIPVTISVGVAAMPSPAIKEPRDLIEAADRALYAAKEQGRNRVCAAET